MEKQFSITRTSREVYSRLFERYTLEQLNNVPAGFKNNLIWNIGHIIVSQQMLTYTCSGLEPMVSKEMITRYMRGTRPESNVTQEEADAIRDLLFPTIDKTAEDYRNGLFTAYSERNTELGFRLLSIEDGIIFNNYHEGVHLGIIMGIRKFI
ncbi:hypothetical protein CHU92_15225 [Flavobacterium cyanobacteriorum]|uniref:DinB-like domain-containing protein n=1 Tax=Flavobacterium cyanobacteriorum TaxID=2022802 RepID=A0A255YRJ1_9FLAO|nr:DinB family protein [Flavobacterium cyanobacteriorum]OYQ31846.1 hypothetical protein CHU92_15225 [Flavobacterium cyanobacteriorum]